MIKKIFMKGYIYIVLAFMYVPLLVLFAYSFNTNPDIGGWEGGFSFQLYADLFTGHNSEKIMTALMNTMIIALASSVLSLIFGTLTAVGIDTMRKRARNTISTVAKLPMINAEIITALAFLIFFGMLQFQAGYLTLIIAHTAFCTPYVLLSVLPKLQQVNNNTFEAALDLGATPIKALTKVIVPQIMPAMISGFIMAFTISMDDFVITQFNIGDFDTLSTYIYTAGIKVPLPAELRALSVLIFIFALALLFLANRMSNRNNKSGDKRIIF